MFRASFFCFFFCTQSVLALSFLWNSTSIWSWRITMFWKWVTGREYEIKYKDEGTIVAAIKPCGKKHAYNKSIRDEKSVNKWFLFYLSLFIRRLLESCFFIKVFFPDLRLDPTSSAWLPTVLQRISAPWFGCFSCPWLARVGTVCLPTIDSPTPQPTDFACEV